MEYTCFKYCQQTVYGKRIHYLRLCRIAHLPKDIGLTTYITKIRPVLEYASFVQEGLPTYLEENLQRLQNTCREPANCPLNGNCLQSSVIYQATVETNDNKPSQTYIGLTENSFKTRFTNHRNSFKDHKKKLSTELSKHVWTLKEANVNFQISWKILKHAASYNPVSERCNLCLWEKYFIICRPELATLNRRNELVSSCRHARKYLLSNLIC